jgi:hypothetical protein
MITEDKIIQMPEPPKIKPPITMPIQKCVDALTELGSFATYHEIMQMGKTGQVKTFMAGNKMLINWEHLCEVLSGEACVREISKQKNPRKNKLQDFDEE